MRSTALSLVGAAALGFAAAAVCFSIWAPRAATAQQVKTPTGLGTPPPTISFGGQPSIPQPLQVQALDADHFVMVSREPRLLTKDGKTAQNVVVTVVTHYTVRGERLIPIENVRVPTGYTVVTVDEQ